MAITETAEPTVDEATDLSIGVSVVVPLFNEEENIDPAVAEILEALDDLPLQSEVILVNDGSSDGTGRKAFEWQLRDPRVRVIEFRRNFGQTAAISAGFSNSRGAAVVVMDGDQQNDPADIRRLLDTMAEGYDVVSGWRSQRQDALLLRKIPSRAANRLISRVTGTRLHDYGCSLKAYDAEVVRHVRLYGELHRFIPALASIAGARIAEIPVNHRPRTRGRSKYGISRTFRVLLDLITVKFMLTYMVKPMQFFGRLALYAFLVAVFSATMVPAQRIGDFQVLKGETFVSLAVLLTVIAVQFVCIGIIGELVSRVYHEGGSRQPYVVRRTGGFVPTPTPQLRPALDLATSGSDRHREP